MLQLKSLTPFNEAEYAKQKAALREQALASARQAYFEEYIRKITDELTKARKDQHQYSHPGTSDGHSQLRA